MSVRRRLGRLLAKGAVLFALSLFASHVAHVSWVRTTNWAQEMAERTALAFSVMKGGAYFSVGSVARICGGWRVGQPPQLNQPGSPPGVVILDDVPAPDSP